jgi:hypothetical protein
MLTLNLVDNETKTSLHPDGGAQAADIQAPEEERLTASFQESKISFAVDVSGSTYGPVLQAEQRAIRSVCSLIPQGMHPDINIIPWTDRPRSPLPIESLHTLKSRGGTDPNQFLEDPDCRLKLQESDFWFLMTDGVIKKTLVRSFARNLTEYGMHGKACVISVFGKRVLKPADCCISVGLSVFAVSPHVAFLYTDVEYDRTYVLCTKGCFSSLLKGREKNISLDNDTRWNELPQISYEDLTRVSVPKAQNLGKDELALQGDIHINISELLTDKNIDEKLMRRILFNEDNRRTLANTAKVRGQADKLAKWLDRVEDTFAQAQDGSGAIGPQMIQDHEKEASTEEEGGSSVLKHESTAIRRRANMMRQASLGEHLDRPCESFLCGIEDDQELDCPAGKDINGNDSRYLANTGFLKPRHSSQYYSSICSLCGRMDVLALLLRDPPLSATTEDFPEAGSLTKLTYPPTMGNYAEADIISDALVCDPCSAKMAGNSDARSKHSIIGALPLVSYVNNQDAWIQTLNLATSRRFSRSDIPLVFLGIIFNKKERLVSEPLTHANLQVALAWLANMIQSEVVLQGDRLEGVIPFGAGRVGEVMLRNFRDCLDPDKFPLLMSYPLDGFIVANAALSKSKHSMVLTQQRQKTVVFLRFLFHLLESFVSYGKENGDVQSHAAKTLILLLDNPSGPGSLFEWKSLRSFSASFKSLEDFQKHLRETVTLDKYRLSLTTRDLLDTPLLISETLDSFRRLGPLFSWIESQCGHAIAVFVHHFMRFDAGNCSTEALFTKLRNVPAVKEALADPGALSARNVYRLINELPALK